MIKSIERMALLLLTVLVFSGCATTAPEVSYNALRVGVTVDSPPLIFNLDGTITGVEADLALKLGKALDRPVDLINLRRDDLIPALIAGKIDIIMAGMTITEVRKALINFSDSYLKSGLATLMRIEDAYRFNSVDDIMGSESSVGAMADTTSETFVREKFTNALNVVPFRRTSDAVYSLKTRRIDLFVFDAPSIVWLVSENEGVLTGFRRRLNVEYLGWGVRKGDDEFLKRVNSVLTNWSQDGTLRQVLMKWLPKWKNFD
jgi:polar amino acid transport system substrate-binding protein